MLWFTIWFMVILKIPILYLAYVIWWAVKDPPTHGGETAWRGVQEGGGGPGPSLRRSRQRVPIPGRRPGPHGTPQRRPAPSLPPARAGKPS